MEEVYAVIREICILIILTSIIDNLLQGSVYRKYVRLVSGIMITLAIISPVLEVISAGDVYAAYVDRYINKLDINEYERELKIYTEEDVTPSFYRDMLDRSLREYLESEGYELINCEWNIVNDEDNEMYGSIRGMNVVVKSGGGHTIDEVHIDENGQIELYNRELEQKLAGYYGISEDIVEVVTD